MEQFLITYLKKKYGLKSLVMEQTKAIVKAVAYFADLDQEINLFSKILSHQVDEHQRTRQMQLVQTVESLIKVNMKGKAWYKNSQEALKAANDIIHGKNKMDHALWSKMLLSMYASTDIEAITILLKNKSYLTKLKEENNQKPGDRRSSATSKNNSRATSKPRVRGRLQSVQGT